MLMIILMTYSLSWRSEWSGCSRLSSGASLSFFTRRPSGTERTNRALEKVRRVS